MTQGINKSYIFQKDEDIKYYIKIMYEINKEYNIQIVAYCIMSNHAHILVKIENIENLSKYMQRINTKYGKYYNKKNQKELITVLKDQYNISFRKIMQLIYVPNGNGNATYLRPQWHRKT